ncbi:MAG TPA: hypothetical protein VFJ43_15410 [Bacteroidia bacterium]|nr:hypothetical protein [Bacteroidia bacterium]
MHLRKTILKEHSKSNTMKIVDWVGKDKKRFSELVNLFLHDEYRVVQRAAWPLSYIAIEHPELAKPYLGKFIRLLSQPDLHPAVQRNILRLLQFIDVPGKYLGALTSSCFNLLIRSDSPVAIKVFAMSVLKNVTLKEPELKRELKLVVEEMMKEGSAGIKARGRKVLKEL